MNSDEANKLIVKVDRLIEENDFEESIRTAENIIDKGVERTALLSKIEKALERIIEDLDEHEENVDRYEFDISTYCNYLDLIKKELSGAKVAPPLYPKIPEVIEKIDYKVGEVETATIKVVAEFGLFCKIGGLDCLLHISDMQENDADLKTQFSAGEEIRVKFISVNQESRKAGLKMAD